MIDAELWEAQQMSDIARAANLNVAYQCRYQDIRRINPNFMVEGGKNYNCSAAQCGEQLLFAYRHVIRQPSLPRMGDSLSSQIWLTTLKDFSTPVGPGMPLKLPVPWRNENPTAKGNNHEDPRLFLHDQKPFLSFVTRSCVSGGFCTGVQNLENAEVAWIPFGKNMTLNGEPLSRCVVTSAKRHEKNWSYFSFDGSLHFVYSIQPHIVVRVSNWRPVITFETDATLDWPFGKPRGGTPPVLLNGEYLTFFHSFITVPEANSGLRRRVYIMGAYAFQARPPFRITKWSPLPLSYGMYSRKAWADVIFPGAALLRENVWHVYYGHNDQECRVMTIRHDQLEASLVGVI